VGNIKDGGFLASVKMGSQDTHTRILNGHSITSERNHLATMLQVKVMKSSFLEGLDDMGMG
jgi:hypothetical protein